MSVKLKRSAEAGKYKVTVDGRELRVVQPSSLPSWSQAVSPLGDLRPKSRWYVIDLEKYMADRLRCRRAYEHKKRARPRPSEWVLFSVKTLSEVRKKLSEGLP